jgi:hypothetical protein
LPILIKVTMEDKVQEKADTDLGIGGKHLAPKNAMDYIRSFMTLTAISGLLAFGGLMGLRIADLSVMMPDLPFVPQVQVSVIDGTDTGIAAVVGEELSQEGWNIVSTTSLADTEPGSPTSANTLVFISEERFRDEADGLVARFPGSIIAVSDQFPDPITLVLGLDYLN